MGSLFALYILVGIFYCLYEILAGRLGADPETPLLPMLKAVGTVFAWLPLALLYWLQRHDA